MLALAPGLTRDELLKTSASTTGDTSGLAISKVFEAFRIDPDGKEIRLFCVRGPAGEKLAKGLAAEEPDKDSIQTREVHVLTFGQFPVGFAISEGVVLLESNDALAALREKILERLKLTPEQKEVLGLS